MRTSGDFGSKRYAWRLGIFKTLCEYFHFPGMIFQVQTVSIPKSHIRLTYISSICFIFEQINKKFHSTSPSYLLTFKLTIIYGKQFCSVTSRTICNKLSYHFYLSKRHFKIFTFFTFKNILSTSLSVKICLPFLNLQ